MTSSVTPPFYARSGGMAMRGVCRGEAHRNGARTRVLCFECYRSRIDRPERVKVLASPFPRVLTRRELAHRRQMLAYLADFSRRSFERAR